MKKDLKITLSVDAKTGEVTAVRNSFDKLDRQVENTNKNLSGMRGKIIAVAGATGAVYGLSKAFGFLVGSGLEYNKSMDASTAKLTAMVSASKGYVTVSGEQVSGMERQRLVAAEVSEMMEILKVTNAQTAMGMSELIDIYALAKPGMDRYKWSVKDQIEIVKLASNTASNFGMSAEELSTGIDDLAAGTWEATSGFGKMMKALGVTKEEFNATGDKVAYLKEKMKETGAAQDTWAVAVSNFTVEWDNMAGRVTQSVFDGAKEGIKEITALIKNNSDTIVSLVGQLISLGRVVVTTTLAWKAQSMIVNPLIGGFRSLELNAESLTGKYIALRFGLKGLLSTLRSFVGANAPFLALVAVYETWSYVTGQVAEKEEELARILGLKGKELEKLTKFQALDALNTLRDQLQLNREETQELQLQYKMARGLGYLQNEETIAIRAKLDTQKQHGKEIQDQMTLMQSVVSGTYQAEAAASNLADKAGSVADETARAAQNAYDLAAAMGGASSAYEISLVKARELSGDISKSSSLTQVAQIQVAQIEAESKALNDLYAAQDADIEKLNIKAITLATQRQNIENGLVSSLKSLEESKRRESVKTDKVYAGTLAKREKEAKNIDDLHRKYLELTGDKVGIFQLDVDASMKDMMTLYDQGIITAEEVGKAYDGMWENYTNNGKNANEEIALDFTDQFSRLFEGLFSGDMSGAFSGFLSGLSMDLSKEMISGLSSSVSGFLKSSLSGLGSFGSGIIGIGLGAISSLLSDEVSQSEIDAAKGRVEFSDNSLKNLGAVFENAQYPMLEVTHKMAKSLRNMDDNFGRVAMAISGKAANSGIDLTGANFVDTVKTGFLGFSSKSVSLIGTGLKFELQSLSDMMNEAEINVRGYTSTLVQKSSFFGLKKKSYTQTTFKSLPQSVRSDIADTFAYGFESIMTAGVSLGLNEANLAAALEASKINIGKVDFTGLSPSEVSERLSSVLSEAMSGVVDGVSEFSMLIERYAKSSEYSMETLGRIAVEYDQASHMFGLIGKTFTDGIMDVTRTWTEETIVQTAQAGTFFGGRFGTALQTAVSGSITGPAVLAGSIFSRLFGRTVQTITETFTETTQELYTVQMQMLDIVESTGGMTEFQDAMGAFMSNFYTEEEQLAFMTRSMQMSFDALGVAMPGTIEGFRTLLETMDTSTEEGAYLYGQVLLLAEGFAAVAKPVEEFKNTLLNVFTTLKEQARSFLDSWAGTNTNNELSYKFYAQRYNDLKAEMGTYFDNGNIKAGVDLDALQSTYSSLESIAGKLGTSSQVLPNLFEGVYDRVYSDFNGYLETFTNHEEVMKVIITGDEVGLANNDTFAALYTAIMQFGSLSAESTSGVPSGVTYYAEGGIVNRPTLGMVGEAGYPEAIIPMKNGRDIPVRIDNSKQEKILQDLVRLTELQANEIRTMRKEIQEMNERTA